MDGPFEHSTPRSRTRWFALALVLTLALGAVDYATGVELSFSIFYLIPVSLAAWFLGRRPAVLVSVLGALTWLWNDHFIGGNVYSHALIPYWNAGVRLGVFLIVSLIVSRLAVALEQERHANRELARSFAALDEMRKQQLQLKDQLLSNVSHELRTPLTAVHQFVTLLLDGVAGDLGPQQKEYLGIVLRNVHQLSRMIKDLLDATRIEAGKLTLEQQPLALDELVGETLSTLQPRAAEAGVSLHAELRSDATNVHADRTRVRQVLFNLVDNALKFTPPGGSVVVRTLRRDEGAGFACVSVSDTGPGMSAGVQEKLFQRLYQEGKEGVGSRKGLGLGLFISRELVTRQGGRMWVESTPGIGSTFSFTLPLTPPAG